MRYFLLLIIGLDVQQTDDASDIIVPCNGDTEYAKQREEGAEESRNNEQKKPRPRRLPTMSLQYNTSQPEQEKLPNVSAMPDSGS